MAIFMLDTDSVNASKSTVDSIANQVDELANTVKGYDTTADDFDFSGPKGVISANIQAFSIKMKNAGAIMESTTSSHTTLQNSLKFQSSEEKEKEAEKEKEKSQETPVGPSQSKPHTSTPYTTYTPYTTTPETPTTPETTPPTSTEITEKITKIDHTKINETLTDDQKKLFENVKYNEAGYALFGEMMVIACSAAFGKIGDIVEFTLNDGTKVRCVIGQILENAPGEVHFIINDTWKEDNEKNPTKDFLNKITKAENFGPANTPIDTSSLPAIGEHTSKWSTLSDDWTVATTKININDYEKVVASKKIAQNSDTSKYSDYCLAFSYVHAYDLYNGVTSDTAADAGNYKHAGAFDSFYSDSKEETLKKVYSEIVQGRPVVMQVNGNTQGTSRHFVTVVGFRNSITSPEALTEKDLLIMDSWDGKVERMDQEKSRFMTTGKQTGKDYTGYYLRTLKV